VAVSFSPGSLVRARGGDWIVLPDPRENLLRLRPLTAALADEIALFLPLESEAERVVVDGKVEGPIQGGDVILKSQAHVVGDVHHRSLAIERGAYFDGRSMQIRGNGQTSGKVEAKSLKQIGNKPESLSRRIERAESVEAN
jgi:hypothetical protein